MELDRTTLLQRAVLAVSRADEHQADPRILRDLVNDIPDPQIAMEVYHVSLITADLSRPAHRVYLEDLAEALILPMPLVRKMREGCRFTGQRRAALGRPQ